MQVVAESLRPLRGRIGAVEVEHDGAAQRQVAEQPSSLSASEPRVLERPLDLVDRVGDPPLVDENPGQCVPNARRCLR